jgi:SOS-response transcriptional repressor LexA
VEPLTKRQAEVLAFISASIDERGVTPSLAEIRAGVSEGQPGRPMSLATVHKHLESLKAKGYITRRRYHARGTTVLVTRNATPEILSAYAAGWEAAVEAGRNDRASAMLAARATWLEGRS